MATITLDGDCDGDPAVTDCDDDDDKRNNFATDINYDGIDQDCDGVDTTGFVCTDECTFAGDGYCDDGGTGSGLLHL